MAATMIQPVMYPCPHCGASFHLTPEYLAQYGGQTTTCTRCQRQFALPTAEAAAQWAGGQPAMQQGPATQMLQYAAPEYGQGGPSTAVWSEGNLVVARKGAQLPYLCVKCGAPAEGKLLRRKYYWHLPIIYLTILAGLLIYVIVALCVRESGTVEIGLCRVHRNRRRVGIAVGLGGLFAGIGLFIAAAILEEGYLVPLGILVLLVGSIAGLLMARVLSPTKIDTQFLWLRGAGPAFLQTLPPVYGQGQPGFPVIPAASAPAR